MYLDKVKWAVDAQPKNKSGILSIPTKRLPSSYFFRALVTRLILWHCKKLDYYRVTNFRNICKWEGGGSYIGTRVTISNRHEEVTIKRWKRHPVHSGLRLDYLAKVSLVYFLSFNLQWSAWKNCRKHPMDPIQSKTIPKNPQWSLRSVRYFI